MSFISGVGLTPYGRHEGLSTLDLMSWAAQEALNDAQLKRAEIDGFLCSYATTMPHVMLATVFAEHFGIQPSYLHALQVGGASGLVMMALASELVDAGVVDHVLVAAGENRLSGQSRDATIQSLAQAGHPDFEVPLGSTIPAYYALVASRYMHSYGVTEENLAELAVLMRSHASGHPGAQFKKPITVADVMASRAIATPLKLLDCCSVSDGAAAFIVSRERVNEYGVRILGSGQAHRHMYATSAGDVSHYGASDAFKIAVAASGVSLRDVDYLAIYDSFTVTLAILLEELGIAKRGESGPMAQSGEFGIHGRLPLNTHGGLLSFGHCGVGGAMAHIVETHVQMTGRAGARQAPNVSLALMQGDGGILSSHVSVFAERVT